MKPQPIHYILLGLTVLMIVYNALALLDVAYQLIQPPVDNDPETDFAIMKNLTNTKNYEENNQSI